MLTLLFLLIWRSVATIHGYVVAYAPTNIAIAYLRSPRGLKWAIPAAVVAVPAYVYVAWLMTTFVDQGATEWLYFITLIAWIDACKYATFAAFALLLLLKSKLSSRAGFRGEGGEACAKSGTMLHRSPSTY